MRRFLFVGLMLAAGTALAGEGPPPHLVEGREVPRQPAVGPEYDIVEGEAVPRDKSRIDPSKYDILGGKEVPRDQKRWNGKSDLRNGEQVPPTYIEPGYDLIGGQPEPMQNRTFEPIPRQRQRPSSPATRSLPSPTPAPRYVPRSVPDLGGATVPFPSVSSAAPYNPPASYAPANIGSTKPTYSFGFDDNAPRPTSRFGYDENMPKTLAPNPKGVNMRLNADPGSIRQEAAPKRLLDRLRPTS